MRFILFMLLMTGYIRELSPRGCCMSKIVCVNYIIGCTSVNANTHSGRGCQYYGQYDLVVLPVVDDNGKYWDVSLSMMWWIISVKKLKRTINWHQVSRRRRDLDSGGTPEFVCHG